MKHWGKYLPLAGRGIKMSSDDIEAAQAKYFRLMNELEVVKFEPDNLEHTFFKNVRADWSIDEITV